jgi:hypothetical protein
MEIICISLLDMLLQTVLIILDRTATVVVRQQRKNCYRYYKLNVFAGLFSGVSGGNSAAHGHVSLPTHLERIVRSRVHQAIERLLAASIFGLQGSGEARRFSTRLVCDEGGNQSSDVASPQGIRLSSDDQVFGRPTRIRPSSRRSVVKMQ